jgi:hypothetical protein
MKAISKGNRLKILPGWSMPGYSRSSLGKNALYPKLELRVKQARAGTPRGKITFRMADPKRIIARAESLHDKCPWERIMARKNCSLLSEYGD